MDWPASRACRWPKVCYKRWRLGQCHIRTKHTESRKSSKRTLFDEHPITSPHRIDPNTVTKTFVICSYFDLFDSLPWLPKHEFRVDYIYFFLVWKSIFLKGQHFEQIRKFPRPSIVTSFWVFFFIILKFLTFWTKCQFCDLFQGDAGFYSEHKPTYLFVTLVFIKNDPTFFFYLWPNFFICVRETIFFWPFYKHISDPVFLQTFFKFDPFFQSDFFIVI